VVDTALPRILKTFGGKNENCGQKNKNGKEYTFSTVVLAWFMYFGWRFFL